jgi:hypothetical protein
MPHAALGSSAERSKTAICDINNKDRVQQRDYNPGLAECQFEMKIGCREGYCDGNGGRGYADF